jgi:thiol-disulfide isomerase/thioredoxin
MGDRASADALPTLFVFDPDLTLWVPWCGPCIGEFPAFQALDRHPGQFQIVALGVQDSRLPTKRKRSAKRRIAGRAW